MPWVWAWPANQRAAQKVQRKSQLRNAIIFGLLCLLFLAIGAALITLAIVFNYDDFYYLFWIGVVLGVKALLMGILFVFYYYKYKHGPVQPTLEMEPQNNIQNNQDHFAADLAMAPPTANAA
jgi:glucan phosphoethanolaminetransferase (alkaline phosphatase superfamily)